MKSSSLFRRFSSLLLACIIVAGGIWAIQHRQTVVDWWRLQSYQPPNVIIQLADNTTMIGKGRELFYISQPTLEGRETFNQHCTNHSEQSIVLGCYKAQRIYLFDVTDRRLPGVEEVTAAHEMLHAAYERMGKDEKQHINAMLEPQIQAVADARLVNLVKLYNKQEPGQLYNEMHSILGTEYRSLSPELEEYYKHYFADRQKIVAYSAQYEGIFETSQARITELDTQLETLRSQIEANNTTLEALQAELGKETERINSFRRNDIPAYNQAVPGYNAKIREFNALVAQNQELVTRFNTLVVERNREAAAQNELYHQLDSRYEVVPQT